MTRQAPVLSIIVPCLNEAQGISTTLAALAPLRARGAEVIVVDGGSVDGTPERAAAFADLVVTAPRGRASQMNAGAARARGAILLFLHADTLLPDGADILIVDGLQRARRGWGRFDVAIAGRHWLLRAVETLMNARSRVTGIATGDQAIFVTRSLFTAAGSYPEIALMEDIALSKRLKGFGPPLCLKHRLTASARRWEKHGVLRTILLMWRLRLAFWLGADPAKLAVRYEDRDGTAVIVFAKAPQPGAVKTRLVPLLGADGAAALQVKLARHTFETVRAASLKPVELHCAPGVDDPFFRFCEGHYGVALRPQTGDDLGARMRSAFEKALATHDRALIVGTDCPALTARHLRQAEKALRDGADAVFVPCEDGGYALIGLTRVDARLFDGIAWGSDSVMTDTRLRLQQIGWTSRELETLWDVDRPEDYARLVGSRLLDDRRATA